MFSKLFYLGSLAGRVSFAMISRIISLSSIASFALIVLLVAPAYAAPSMILGGNANYSLSASFNAAQSCNASPLTYNQTACGPPVPEYHAYIYDYNGQCSLNGTFQCFFSPQNMTVQPGYPVVWSNYGQVPHGVASCDPANSPNSQACPVNDSFGLDSFNSGVISPGATFSHTFTAQGTYYYFDPVHPWVHGRVDVNMFAQPPPPEPTSPQITPFPISLSGSLGWSVVGLDKNTAVLNVTHALSVTVDGIPIAPVSGSGSFQQSIDLATRAQALGSSAEMIDNFALPLLASLLSGSPFGTGSLTSATSTMDNMPTIYTVWWINGPVSKGSPVQILAGYASVQGDETVSLAGSIGSRSAWIVTSNVQESVSTIVPQLGTGGPSGATNSNNADLRLAMRFDYDKSSDLLLASSDSAVVVSTMMNVYLPGQLLCGPFGDSTTVNTPTTVTHVMTVNVGASLTLSSTSLNLGRRMSLSAQALPSMFSMLQDPTSISVLYTLAGLVAAAIAGLAVLFTRRKSRPVPLPTPTAPLRPTAPASP